MGEPHSTTLWLAAEVKGGEVVMTNRLRACLHTTMHDNTLAYTTVSMQAVSLSVNGDEVIIHTLYILGVKTDTGRTAAHSVLVWRVAAHCFYTVAYHGFGLEQAVFCDVKACADTTGHLVSLQHIVAGTDVAVVHVWLSGVMRQHNARCVIRFVKGCQHILVESSGVSQTTPVSIVANTVSVGWEVHIHKFSSVVVVGVVKPPTKAWNSDTCTNSQVAVASVNQALHVDNRPSAVVDSSVWCAATCTVIFVHIGGIPSRANTKATNRMTAYILTTGIAPPIHQVVGYSLVQLVNALAFTITPPITKHCACVA